MTSKKTDKKAPARTARPLSKEAMLDEMHEQWLALKKKYPNRKVWLSA